MGASWFLHLLCFVLPVQIQCPHALLIPSNRVDRFDRSNRFDRIQSIKPIQVVRSTPPIRLIRPIQPARSPVREDENRQQNSINKSISISSIAPTRLAARESCLF
jgi:hypothetical protein